MATTLKGFGRTNKQEKPMKQYKSVIQLSDVPAGKYNSRKAMTAAEPSSGDLKGGSKFVLALPLGIIVLIAIAIGFDGAVSGGAYSLLIALSAILVAILVYVAVTLLGDSD